MSNWKLILKDTFQHPKMVALKQHIQAERKSGKKIYPEGKNLFKPFDLCPFGSTRVVIVGDSPYCTEGTADGLAFSTQQEERPAELSTIFKSIYRDLNIQYNHGLCFEDFFESNNLSEWARNGFLLLNSELSTEHGIPSAHEGKGWELIIEKAIKALVELDDRQIVFLFWGDKAKQYESLISGKHVFFSSCSPSNEELFMTSGHFSIIRDICPTFESDSPIKKVNADMCFDKEMAKELAKQNYPIDAKRICDYIDNYLIINIPVNPELYRQEMNKFELILSTKKNNNERS